jgi:hypothetical protein
VAVTQEDVPVFCGQVEFAVAVEVADRHVIGIRADAVEARVLQRAVTPAKENPEETRLNRHDHVGLPSLLTSASAGEPGQPL